MKYRWFLISSLCLLLMQRADAAPPDAPLLDESAVKAVVKRFATEIKCRATSKDTHRHWCPVTKVGAGAVKLPTQPTTWIGFSVIIGAEGSVLKAVSEETRLTLLTLGPSSAHLTPLLPANEGQSEAWGLATRPLIEIFKGSNQATSLQLPASLIEHLKVQTQSKGEALILTAEGAHFASQAPNRLYQVSHLPYGKAYVVFEQRPNGTQVSLFPLLDYTP